MTTFSDMRLSRPILDAIASEGYDTPTPIQAQSIPVVLDGRDILACAQTGTGKTAAFSLPIIEQLHRAKANKSGSRRRPGGCPAVLILSPTRELAGQIEQSIKTYGAGTGVRQTVIYGGVSQYHQVRRLRAGIDVLIATPGRLQDLMEQGYIDLSCVETLVLDEADRMLDMGFIKPIRQIASEIPASRQTLLFSATMPESIVALANSLLRDPVRVSVTPDVAAAPSIEQSLYLLAQEHKPKLLAHLLGDPGVERAVVFTRTKHGADRLVKFLGREGLEGAAIHGNKSQNQRNRALNDFRSGRCPVLVATDVAARGLDVDGITHVFNFDLPNEPEAYVHRIGRTGRAGATGLAVAFCSRDERRLLRDIERLLDEEIATAELPDSLGIPAEERAKPRHRRGGGGRKPNPQSGGGRKPSNRRKRSSRRSGGGGKGGKARAKQARA